MSIREEITQKEKELADLRERERVEQEEAERKAAKERDADLMAIMEKVKAFNKKYNEHMILKDERFVTFPFIW